MILVIWAAFVDPERQRRNRGDPNVVRFWFCGRRTCSSNSRKRTGLRVRGGKRPATKPSQGSSPASSMPGQVSRPSSHLHGIACWRARRSRSRWGMLPLGCAASRESKRPVPYDARILQAEVSLPSARP